MTKTEFVDYVRANLNADSDSFWSDDEILKLAEVRSNEILSIIGLIEARDTSITTVSGTQAYSFPTDFETVIEVMYDGDPLNISTFDDWRRFRQIGASTNTIQGTPTKYIIFNRQIYLIPIPSAADTLTIFGEKKQGELSTTTGTIDIPAVLHGRLADGVLFEMHMKEKNVDLADRMLRRWEQFHMPAFHEYKRRYKRRGGPATIIDVHTDIIDDAGFFHHG